MSLYFLVHKITKHQYKNSPFDHKIYNMYMYNNIKHTIYGNTNLYFIACTVYRYGRYIHTSFTLSMLQLTIIYCIMSLREQTDFSIKKVFTDCCILYSIGYPECLQVHLPVVYIIR